LSLRSDNLDSVAELYPEDDFRQLVVAIETTPTFFCSLGELEEYEKTRRDKRKADRKCEIAAMRMNVGHDPLSACLRYIVRYIDLDLSPLALCTPLEREFSIRTRPGNMIDSLFTIRRTSFLAGIEAPRSARRHLGEAIFSIWMLPRRGHARVGTDCSLCTKPSTGSWSAFSEGNRSWSPYSNANRAVRCALPEAEPAR
jgi:hypothetical protein